MWEGFGKEKEKILLYVYSEAGVLQNSVKYGRVCLKKKKKERVLHRFPQKKHSLGIKGNTHPSLDVKSLKNLILVQNHKLFEAICNYFDWSFSTPCLFLCSGDY